MNKIRHLVVILSLLLGAASLHAASDATQIKVEISRTPAQAALKIDARILPDGRGRRTIEVELTNTSSSDQKLGNMRVSFPWASLDETHDAVMAGGWDMGRTESRVHKPTDKGIRTGTYLLARAGGAHALAGFVTWRVFQSKLSLAEDHLVVEADGESRLLRPGETVAMEKVWLADGNDWQDLLFGYADEIAAMNAIRLNRPDRFTGWATWDYYGRNWSFQNVIDNMDALLKIIPDADFLQIDGGWWPQRGDYTRVRESLQPDGMRRLGEAIRAKGLIAGIHLDGMRGDSKAMVAREHPAYFLHDQNGRMLVERTKNVGESLDYTFFDYSNPAACDYMRDALRQIRRDWGYTYFKIDFLRFGLGEFVRMATTDGGTREIVARDNRMTSLERFHRGMAAFREGMGKDAYFLGCSAVFGPTFGHVDGLRTGADINPQFRQYARCALDNSGNFYLHGKVVYNDTDYLVVRGKDDQDSTRVPVPHKDGSKTTFNEAEMWAHYVALFGRVKLSSDNLPILTEERRALVRLAASIPSSERFVPLDIWEHATSPDDPPCVMLGVQAGTVYLGLFNWSAASRDFHLDGFKGKDLQALKKLGGSGRVQSDEGTLTVGLPSRHSSIFAIEGADFDRLRKTIRIK